MPDGSGRRGRWRGALDCPSHCLPVEEDDVGPGRTLPGADESQEPRCSLPTSCQARLKSDLHSLVASEEAKVPRKGYSKESSSFAPTAPMHRQEHWCGLAARIGGWRRRFETVQSYSLRIARHSGRMAIMERQHCRQDRSVAS